MAIWIPIVVIMACCLGARAFYKRYVQEDPDYVPIFTVFLVIVGIVFALGWWLSGLVR